MRHRAFTLLELMIVITIIAVLASLTMTVVGQARGLAETRTCQSNLRQMQFASLTYAQENRGYFVAVYWRKANGGKDIPWRSNTIFLNYLTDGRVTDGQGNNVLRKALCPTVRKSKKDALNSSITWLELSYGYNTQQPDTNKLGNIGPTTRDLGVGKRITFIDGLDWEITNSDEINNNFLTVPLPEGKFAQGTVAFRHRKNANYALGDGSVSNKGYTYLRSRFPRSENGGSNLWNP